MSKWKCEICGLEFENFHAQGFNHKIYCPLCYYKELYKINTEEIDRLNNIINELENTIVNFIEKHTEDYIDWKYDRKIYLAESNILQKLFDTYLYKLKELNGDDKSEY